MGAVVFDAETHLGPVDILGVGIELGRAFP